MVRGGRGRRGVHERGVLCARRWRGQRLWQRLLVCGDKSARTVMTHARGARLRRMGWMGGMGVHRVGLGGGRCSDGTTSIRGELGLRYIWTAATRFAWSTGALARNLRLSFRRRSRIPFVLMIGRVDNVDARWGSGHNRGGATSSLLDELLLFLFHAEHRAHLLESLWVVSNSEAHNNWGHALDAVRCGGRDIGIDGIRPTADRHSPALLGRESRLRRRRHACRVSRIL